MDLTAKQKQVIMYAIMASYVFAGLNITIVSPALPRIIATIGGMEYFSWIATSYAMVASIVTILVGRLSDIYGRRIFLLSGLVFFLIAALLAGFCQTPLHLIVCRAFQGIGGGMITSCAFSAAGDLYAPQERAKWQGLLNGVFGVTAVLGPVLGGLIVDYLNWRWIFFIFLPFGLVTLLLLLKLFPVSAKQEGERIDFAGSAVITALMITLLSLFSSVGTRFSWVSKEMFGLVTLSCVLLGMLIFIENSVKTPILPMNLFLRRDYVISCVISFINGLSLYSITYYVAFFVQGVQGKSATESGMVNMPVSVIMMFCSAIVGGLVTKTGHYKRYVLTGLSVIVIGMSCFWIMELKTPLPWIAFSAIVTGAGLGICLPIVMLSTQISVEKRLLGVATSSFKMFRQFGGTIGIAVMSIVMNSGFTSRFAVLQANSLSIPQLLDAPETAPLLAQIVSPQILMDPPKLVSILQSLPAYLQQPFETMLIELRVVFGAALKGVFLLEVVFALTALAFGFLIREIPLSSTND